MSIKGASGNAKNYFGSIAGVACAGPIDELVSFILDGKTIWPTDTGWADDIVGLVPINYSRSGNIARVQFSDPIRLKVSATQFFILTGMADASFNTPTSPTFAHVHDASDYVVKYSNVGANIGITDTSQGSLTKVVHYNVNDLVRYAGGIWQCILAHYSTPANSPPNATYWSPYSVTRDLSANPFGPFSVVDHVAGVAYGNAYMGWGTSAQTLRAGTFLVGHPPYRRQVYVELEKFLFGTERQSPPNVEILVRRKPAQTIIVGASAELDGDAQANPLCCIAELMTDPVFGIGVDPSIMDAVSWQATADWLAANSASTYISPSLEKGDSVRALIGMILAYYDGWLRFNGAGKIEAGRFLHNEAPPAFTAATTIDYNDCIEEIAWDSDLWPATFNETVCKFQDMARAYKDAAQSWKSGYNRQVTGEPRKATVERLWITRETQALAHASEWGKINAQPKLSGTLQVRAEKCSSIRQGDLFKLTHDAVQLSIACRCAEKTLADPPAGKATLRFESERGIAPLPYQPTIANPGGTAFPHPEQIRLYQFVQPPPLLSGSQDFGLMILAARTSAMTRGMRPWLRVDDVTGFYQLGEQRGWAVSGTLAQNYSLPASATTAERGRTANVATLKVVAHGYASGLHVSVGGLGGAGYNLTDVVITVIDADHFSYPSPGADEATTADANGEVDPLADDDTETLQLNFDENTVQSDLDKISATQTADAINDAALLVWLFSASDPTQFEIAALKDIRLDSGVYKLKVRRARFATAARAFVTSDLAWVVWRSDLVQYTHSKFADYAASATPATFRLQSFTGYEDADLTDADVCPDVTFTFANPYAPQVAFSSVTADGSEITDFTTNYATTTAFAVSMVFTDAGADLVEASLVARLGSAETLLWSQTLPASSPQLRTASFKLPSNGEWSILAKVKDAAGTVTQKYLTPGGGGSTVTLLIGVGTGGATVASPTMTPDPGDYPSPIVVHISCSTSGAAIFYQITAAGTAYNPASWVAYSGSFSLGLTITGKTVWAYATKAGLTDSPIVGNDYQKITNL